MCREALHIYVLTVKEGTVMVRVIRLWDEKPEDPGLNSRSSIQKYSPLAL